MIVCDYALASSNRSLKITINLHFQKLKQSVCALPKISVAGEETGTPFESQISSATFIKKQVYLNVIASLRIIR